MELLNTDTPTVKTETADVRALLRTLINGNEHAHVARNGGNGRRRRPRRQIHHGYRRAVWRADTAVRLVESGMSVTEAIERCEISSAYFYAMKAVRGSGDADLYEAVLEGRESLFAAAARVKNAATVITAFAKCSELEKGLIWIATGMTADLPMLLESSTPDQLVGAAHALGINWIWDRMVVAAMPAKAATEQAAANGKPAA